MVKRRKGTIPQRVMLTQATVDRIDAYQEQHQIPSFSAAAETLLRIGLEESPAEILAPIIVSTLRASVHRELQRLIQLQIYTAIEAGVGQRFAAAAVRDIGRLKHDAPERYDNIKAAAIADTRRRLLGDNIGKVVADLYAELAGTEQGPSTANDGQRGGGPDDHGDALPLPQE